MTLVLLVLAAVWAAVLIPPALRRRTEGRPSDSISHFRRQLAVLRRTGPRSSRIGANDQWSTSYAPYGGPAPQLATVSHLNAVRARRNGYAPVAARPRAAAARSRTLRRRRDVLTVLVSVAAGTLLLGAIPALRVLWMVHLVTDVLLIAYVALLIRQRNAAAARDIDARFLPHTGGFDPSLMPGEPAMLRRSAN